MRAIQTKTDFNLIVYPSGKGWESDQLPHVMYFPDQKVKDAYVSDEWKFCAAEYSAYKSADCKEERTKAHTALLARRAFYAQQRGYYPSMKDTKQWYYRAPADKVNA